MIREIWAKDENGNDILWKVERELFNMFEIFHGFLVTHIDKRLVLKTKKDGKDIWQYSKVLSVPSDPNKPVRSYFLWTTRTIKHLRILKGV